ncbi:MAG: hypothetical protein ACJ76H_13125 [Bacteriovoracaceae bacterium]
MKILSIFFFFFTSAAFAYECSIQAEFYRGLPVFLGTTGTMEITTENILVLNNRGTGVQSETKGNTVRYFYPAERIEAHVIKTTLDNGDVSVITAPKYFNCNVRHALLRGQKILSLSYCSVDGCRHLNREVCSALGKNFSEETLKTAKNPLTSVFDTEIQVKAMTKSLHQENSLLMREYHKLSQHSQRVLGVSMTDYETEEGSSAPHGLFKLGGILSSETEYCRSLERQGMFWKEDLRPSKFLKKTE